MFLCFGFFSLFVDDDITFLFLLNLKGLIYDIKITIFEKKIDYFFQIKSIIDFFNFFIII